MLKKCSAVRRDDCLWNVMRAFPRSSISMKIHWELWFGYAVVFETLVLNTLKCSTHQKFNSPLDLVVNHKVHDPSYVFLCEIRESSIAQQKNKVNVEKNMLLHALPYPQNFDSWSHLPFWKNDDCDEDDDDADKSTFSLAYIVEHTVEHSDSSHVSIF